MRTPFILGTLCAGVGLCVCPVGRAQVVVALDARNGFDSAYNLATGDDFSQFRSRITSQGYTTVAQSSFDAASLADVNALVILQPFSNSNAFSDSELQDIENFVQGGKGLLVLGDAGASSAASLLNSLSSRFGVLYAENAQDQAGHVVSGFVLHPVTGTPNSIGSIGIDFQRPLTVSGGALDLTLGAGADNFLAVSSPSISGKAVFLSDSSLFSNPDSGADYPLSFGDNAKLLDNVLQFTAPVPEPIEYGLFTGLALLGIAIVRRRHRKRKGSLESSPPPSLQ